ncbi:transcription factor TDR isoform X5 [Nymphaea colorata]|uniref:transcription factor TDR isoform X5 n=1 Tax=Nymphaea colorata TaxID=210225 RepID=UPI00214E0AC2|nr:transcription factor TDR isoform X5 [Nymphaea colorata]
MPIMKSLNCPESAIERLRPLVGNKRWEYCVFWRLLDDQSCLEWTECCCFGAEQEENSGQLFPVSPSMDQDSNAAPFRDMSLQHTKTKTGDLLSELLTFLSDQPKWIISPIEVFPVNSKMLATTKVLIPVPSGLVELYMSNHVPEDPHVVQFVMAQFKDCWASNCASSSSSQLHEDHHQAAVSILGSNSTSPQSFHFCAQDASIAQAHPIDRGSAGYLSQLLAEGAANYDEPTNQQQQQQQMKQQFLDSASATSFDQWLPENLPWRDNPLATSFKEWLPKNLPCDATADQVRLLTSASFSFLGKKFQVFGISESNQTRPKNDANKKIIKEKMGRTDSISDCSKQNQDGADRKTMERGERRHQSKNLEAERKRREKLTDRLYTLRSIVPKITRMDGASILADAIEYVKELQKQVKDLQGKLEDIPGGGQKDSSAPPEHQNGVSRPGEYEESSNGLRMEDQATRLFYSTKTTRHPKENADCGSRDDNGQQVEVEVTQVGEHQFRLKILCENRACGFSRLMQAMDSLGLEVIKVNIIAFRSLVLYLFKVEMRDTEAIEADQLRKSFLELTRYPIGSPELV